MGVFSRALDARDLDLDLGVPTLAIRRPFSTGLNEKLEVEGGTGLISIKPYLSRVGGGVLKCGRWVSE